MGQVDDDRVKFEISTVLTRKVSSKLALSCLHAALEMEKSRLLE